MIKQLTIIFLFIFSITSGQEQQATIDSLKQKLIIAKEDTNKVNLLNQLSRANEYSASDSGVMYAQKALELAEKIKFNEGIILAELNQCGSFNALGNFRQSLYYAFKALSLAKETNNSYLIIRSNAKLHECYYYLGEYTNAFIYSLETMKLVKKYVPDKIYLPWSDIAKDYEGMNQPDSALFYAKKAYEMNAIKGSIIESYNLVTIGDAYTSKAEYDSAKFYYQAGIPPAIANNIVLDLIDLYNGIAEIHKIKNNLDSATWYSKKVLLEKNGKNYPLGLLRTVKMLADIYELQNKPDSALKYLRSAILLKDSLFSREKTMAIQNLAYKEREKQKEVEASKLKYQTRLKIFSLLGGFLTLLVIAVILFRNNRHKQKAYSLLQNQKEETDKQKSRVEQTLEELESTQTQLIQREKMASLGELTAGIAHEIQNPLNFVNNFSEVSTELVDEMNDEVVKGNMEYAKQIAQDLKQNLEKINHHGKRAGDIVKSMLQHSRSSSGKKEPTDINSLCEEYLRLSYHGLRAKDKSFNVTMKTDFDNTIGNINIIPQDIGRVVLNLLTNAFYVVNEKKQQQSPDGGYEPTVSVSTKKIGDKVEIRVSDNGNGIPQKILDKIFQPFFTTKPTGQGTGLGLSLSYDIVKAHGGEIKVETKEGEGTTFIISLPEK